MLTLEQKDQLATFCGWPRIQPSGIRDGHIISYDAYSCYYGVIPIDKWHPDTSRDDCWPILQRIEESGSWTQFFPTKAFTNWLTSTQIWQEHMIMIPADWMRLAMLVPPSVIVAAVLQIIEAKGGYAIQ